MNILTSNSAMVSVRNVPKNIILILTFINCFSHTQEMVFLGRLLQWIGEAPLWALDKDGFKTLLAHPGTLAVFSGIILYGAGYGISLTVLPGFLIQEKGFTQAQVGGFFTLFYVGISLSQIITGPVSGRRTH
jgi:hypothetical protein